MAPAPISLEEERRRKIINVNAETVTNVTSTDFPGNYPGEDHAWSLGHFAQSFHVQFHKNGPYDASFSLIHIDASIANAFRRILIDEIPTLAIETVFVHNNTSIVQDEVLASRLGLVPLTGARKGINWLQYEKKRPASLDDETGPYGSGGGPDGQERDARDNNTVVLKLQVECGWNPDRKDDDSSDDELDPGKVYTNSSVYASDIKFEAMGRQSEYFAAEEGEEEGSGEVRAFNPRILLAKMRPGQCIDIEMHAVKGIGADHAKFSPVATATYRLLPTIDIVKPIVGEDAIKFARCFPKGVIGLEAVTEEENEREGSGLEGMHMRKKAFVRNTMKDTVSRECLRHPEFEGKVKLGRMRDHFIFSVESTGQFESDILFLDSVRILKAKCAVLQRDLAQVLR